MQKLEDVVIPMQQNFEDIKLLFPSNISWEQWKRYKPDIPFSDQVIEFLDALSMALLKDKESRLYPDVITFAFFCRKANMLNLKKQYVSDQIRLGRGILFHIAPSNVPVNFGYSLVAGLISGNHNIVRVSSKEFYQVKLVTKHISTLAAIDALREIADRIVLVRYDRSSSATSFFSSFCDVRIIWGGDETISQIRNSPIPARSYDVTFADRYSLAVINADEIENNDIAKLAEGFYNDTYLFDQNACSAPHTVIWLGNQERISKAQDMFWKAVHLEVKKKYEFQPIMAIDKLTAFYHQAVSMPIQKEEAEDNMLLRVNLKRLPSNIDEFRCACGYFSEFVASSLDEIVPIINNKYQTMAYYGFDKQRLTRLVLENNITGIDRIVPIGTTSDFAFFWDGYNLIDTLSREISIL